MIDIKEIDEEIKRLENSDCTTYRVCEKLASLYTVKHYFSKRDSVENKNTITPSPMTMMPK